MAHPTVGQAIVVTVVIVDNHNNLLLAKTGFCFLFQTNDNNPYWKGDKRLSVVAKKSPRVKRVSVSYWDTIREY